MIQIGRTQIMKFIGIVYYSSIEMLLLTQCPVLWSMLYKMRHRGNNAPTHYSGTPCSVSHWEIW